MRISSKCNLEELIVEMLPSFAVLTLFPIGKDGQDILPLALSFLLPDGLATK